MNNLYKAIMAELETIDDNIQASGLYVTIDGFDFYASFEDDSGYQLLNSQEAQQLIDLNQAEKLEKLREIVHQVQAYWQDTLIADYEMQCQARGDNDPNWHGMNAKSNWV